MGVQELRVSRTSKIIRGLGLAYVQQVLMVFVGLWLTPFLLFRIGQHDYGLWLVGTQLMFYLGLLDLGVTALLPRETAFATGRAGSLSEAKELPSIIGQTSRLVLWQTPIVAMAAIAVWLFLPNEWAGLQQPIAVVLGTFVLTFPLRIFGAVLQGLQDLSFIGKANMAGFFIGTGVTVTLVLTGFGLYAVALGWAVTQVSTAGANWYRLRKHFPGVLPPSLPKLRREIVRVQMKQGFWISSNQIAQVLLTGTDLLIIGKLFGPLAVVPYACTAKLISVMSNQPQLLMQAATPALSQLRAGESRERLSQVCIALTQAMLMISGAVVCIVLAVNQGFVGRWVGADQFGGLALTALILLSMLLRHWNVTLGYALFSFGYEKRLCATAVTDGVITVGAIAVFVSLFGIAGAPLGSILGVSCISLPLNLRALAREANVSFTQLTRPLAPWFGRFVVLAICAAVIARVWTPSTLPLIGLTAAAVGLIYGLAMFPVVLREPLGSYVRPRLPKFGIKFLRGLRAEEVA
jgi:O-antigen/teichoic acid export membrane protein